MQLAKKLIVIVAITGVVVPLTARDCLSGFGFNIGAWGPCGGCGFGLNFCLCSPCFRCQRQPAYCGCGAQPMMAPQPTVVPSVGYRQEQFITYRDVPQTQVRREAYIENVPVTTFQQVTKTVYVPQQVTEMVPQTAYQQQTRYRDVAYQSTQRIAETHTRLVPQPTVPFTQPINYTAPGCAAPALPSYSTAPLPTATPTGIAPIYSSPSIPTMPSMTVSPYGASTSYGTTNPVVPQYPDVPSASNGLTPIGPRLSANPTPARRPGMFRPAPSAATVQQSRRF